MNEITRIKCCNFITQGSCFKIGTCFSFSKQGIMFGRYKFTFLQLSNLLGKIKSISFKTAFKGFSLSLLLSVIACYLSVEYSAHNYLYDEQKEIPYSEVGLVLGTSKRLSDGGPNLYFNYRLKAAYQLYASGKVKYLLLSGDNHSKYYNEPMDMKKALVKMGVPDKAIVLDYAGFRTLDSVVRCNKVFGQHKFTIISQPFHNKRAIYLARNLGLDAVAYNAEDVRLSLGIKVHAREVLARVKAFIDLHVINTQPKFLGSKIQIAQN